MIRRKFSFGLVAATWPLWIGTSDAATTKDLIEAAPTIQLLLDNSEGSPAIDEDFVAAAWPLIETKLRAMPLGTVVIVNTVGNASLKPLMMRTRIQKKTTNEGASIGEVVQAVKMSTLGLPQLAKNKEHNQSHIIGGIFDASKNLNKKASSPNVIIILSDFVEYSPFANCYKGKACQLPKPSFSLGNTEVMALGVGRGLASNREMVVFTAWEKFFIQTGATFDLKKTF